jgi:hypothetical protein
LVSRMRTIAEQLARQDDRADVIGVVGDKVPFICGGPKQPDSEHVAGPEPYDAGRKFVLKEQIRRREQLLENYIKLHRQISELVDVAGKTWGEQLALDREINELAFHDGHRDDFDFQVWGNPENLERSWSMLCYPPWIAKSSLGEAYRIAGRFRGTHTGDSARDGD